MDELPTNEWDWDWDEASITQEKQYGDWTAVYASFTVFSGLETVSDYDAQ